MDELSALAEKYKTDKGLWHHGYTPHYHRHLQHLRQTAECVLELGIGGYEYHDRGGESLRMWADYFNVAEIHGVDIHDKSGIKKRVGIHTHIGSQDDVNFLVDLVGKIGNPDVVIDDASHINSLSIRSFQILFPMLKPGGIYICEDVETSYWPEHGYGGSTNITNLNENTAVNYFMRLVHKINLKECEWPIKSIHFYPGTVIIEKL